MKRSLLVSLLLAAVAVASEPAQPVAHPKRAYFYVAEGGKKCFYENTPQALPVTISYQVYDNPGVS